jgi:LCP family protein required for cell wall assembly
MPLWGKAVTTVVVLLALLAGSYLITAGVLAKRFNDHVGRDDALGDAAALPAITAEPEYTKNPSWVWTNPKPSSTTSDTIPSDAGQNLLVLGVDTRAGQTQSQSRSDTIMLVHVNAAKTAASVISFPRDSYVYIPPVSGKWAGGKTKINAAYAWGGAPLMVQVLNHLTGATIDHVIRVDFSAVRDITDIVGGVDVYVPKTVTDKRTGVTFHTGNHHLDGKLAEVYVRQRYGLPNGDFDRVKRQQTYLHALASKVLSLGVVANPVKLDDFVTAVAGNLVVDKNLDLLATARQLSGLRPDDLTFTTLPSKGYIRSHAGTANKLITDQCAELFFALRTDAMDAYFNEHKPFTANTGA